MFRQRAAPIILLILAVCMVFLSSCAWLNENIGLKPGDGICSEPESEGSVICHIAEERNTTPETISNSILFTNLLALEFKVVDKNDILKGVKFFNESIGKLEAAQKLFRDSGYALDIEDMINFLDKRYEYLPPSLQESIRIIGIKNFSATVLKMPFIDRDFDMLIYHLRRQRDLISVYLE